MNAVLKVFHRLLDELEAAKAPYMVMGGWAVQVWGRPRPTYDVDFTLSLSDCGPMRLPWASTLGVRDALEKVLTG